MNSSFLDYEMFNQICPVMLFNFELGYCDYDTGREGLSGAQSKLS